MTNVVKKGILVVLAMLLLVAGGQVLAQKWSAGVLKNIEELKILARDKKDMAESMPGIKKITGDELKAWLDQGRKFVLLDNRVPADYEKEHISGTTMRLSPDDLLEKGPGLAARFKKEDIIVNYCNGIKCWRSSGAMLLLQELGFKDLYWYREGIPDWVKKGYPTVEGKK